MWLFFIPMPSSLKALFWCCASKLPPHASMLAKSVNGESNDTPYPVISEQQASSG